MDLHNAPDWVPFACLVTGKLPMRKPFVTRIVEGILMGAVSAGLTLYVGVKVLERDFVSEKARLDAHLVQYNADRVRADADIARSRLDALNMGENIVRKLERIEDCIRVRTCTK